MTPDRNIRLFISSTFRDMQPEREHLLKRSFPQIRKLCESRGVTWDEVDLRWGIPDEQRSEGKVLPLCLEEIDRCRPYFLGLLGERYGMRVDIPGDLMARHPWLAGHQECSMTELEILHGVLSQPTAGQALFYFRDPACLLPADADPADYHNPDEASAVRLRDLKERIRQSGATIRDGYRSPEELGAWVEEDLCRLIDRLFPAEAGHDPVAAAHRQFAAVRRRLWVGRGRRAELQRLKEMMAFGRVALVTGPAGVGLSSFLANWTAAWRDAHPGMLVVEHYVGAHPAATSLDGCCRQLCLALASGRGQPVPEAAVEGDWPDLFIEILASAAAAGPVLLVIDGADRLQGRGEEAGAVWLPSELPEGVRLVASAGEEAAQALEDRGWPLLRLRGLSAADRADFVRTYLAFYGKELSAERVEQIADGTATANPFYLTLLLEELRQYGDHETLGARIGELLAAPDVAELCRSIFTRCEQDYDEGLTAGALGLLAMARTGLSDVEMCELLGGPRGRLPQRPWSRLQLALQRVLVSRGGLVGFAQAEAAEAARQRYVPTLEQQDALHRQLADFFLARPASEHAAAELPFHLHRLSAWDELAGWLSRPDAFATIWRIAPDEVCRSWAEVESRTAHRAARASAAFPPVLRPAVLSLLRQLGHWPEALSLAREAAEQADAEGSPERQLETLLVVGEIELAAGSAYEAATVFARAEARASAQGDSRALLRALHGHVRALRALPFARSGSPAVRATLNREIHMLIERALRIQESTEDAALQAEAMVLWLEDLVSRGFSLFSLFLIQEMGMGELLRRLIAPAEGAPPTSRSDPSQLLDRQMAQVKRTREERMKSLEDKAVGRLRQTRHRALALRAEVALTKARGDKDGFELALEALRQHAAARDDHELLASVYEEIAGRHSDGEEKLASLRAQEQWLDRAGRLPALVRNRWTQAEVLWPGLGRRAEAMELARRVAREQRALPSLSQRLLFRIFRLRLALGLDDRRLRALVGPGLWILVPLWLWGVWLFRGWVASWFSRLPALGILAYLFALVAALPGFILLAELLSGLSKLRRRLRRAGRTVPRPAPVPVPVPVPVQEPEAEAPREPGRRQGTGDEGLDKIIAWSSGFIRLYARMARATIRNHRLGFRMGLDRLPVRLAWAAVTLPAGIVSTLWYWRASGWGRLGLFPLGLIGQLLVLEALAGLLFPLIAQKIARRRPLLPIKIGSQLRFATLLGLLRLKRRLLGRRRGRRSGEL